MQLIKASCATYDKWYGISIGIMFTEALVIVYVSAEYNIRLNAGLSKNLTRKVIMGMLDP